MWTVALWNAPLIVTIAIIVGAASYFETVAIHRAITVLYPNLMTALSHLQKVLAWLMPALERMRRLNQAHQAFCAWSLIKGCVEWSPGQANNSRTIILRRLEHCRITCLGSSTKLTALGTEMWYGYNGIVRWSNIAGPVSLAAYHQVDKLLAGSRLRCR